MNIIAPMSSNQLSQISRHILLPLVALSLSGCGALGIKPSEELSESLEVDDIASEPLVGQADNVQFKLDAELAEANKAAIEADAELISAEAEPDLSAEPELPETGVQVATAGVDLPDTAIEIIDSESEVQVDAVAEVDVAKPESGTERVGNWATPRPAPVKWNIYDTMESNYVSLFADYEEVERSVLVFPNDSLRLGDANKEIIQQYAEKLDPETDVLSVIGCSHGTTSIDNGNSLLALGRANRVKEAFLFSGVSHEKVMDEGCWAPQTFDEVMPRRGVVLTLKRRKNS